MIRNNYELFFLGETMHRNDQKIVLEKLNKSISIARNIAQYVFFTFEVFMNFPALQVYYRILKYFLS
jgi:hypothetical protein